VPQPFRVSIASDLARAFGEADVDYLFIGKSGAILLGYPGTTQDVDVFPAKGPENGNKIIAALKKLGFDFDAQLASDILASRDFVQIKNGPFDIDLVFAPDGIASFAEARNRRIVHENFPIASLKDIIASKRASGREKDFIDLPLLEDFRQEYERANPQPLRSARDILNKQ
jgi:hypothetical protein